MQNKQWKGIYWVARTSDIPQLNGAVRNPTSDNRTLSIVSAGGDGCAARPPQRGLQHRLLLHGITVPQTDSAIL